MNILVLHNAYREAGGEERAVATEVGLLRAAGHAVRLETVSNSTLGHAPAALSALLRVGGDPQRAAWVRDLIRASGAEIVHVHNFFPLLTPSVHAAARAEGAGVVQTLHNIRLLCAASSFMRAGQSCTKCAGGALHWGAVHRCYRGSLPASLGLWHMQRQRPNLMRDVHRFITLTDVARQHFLRDGFPADRLVVKGNTAPRPARPSGPRRGVLYAGRLTAEKGLLDLLAAAWALPDIPVTVVGGGPLEPLLRAKAPANMTLLGYRNAEEVARLMAGSALLVVPSTGAEGFPLVLAEAFACGLPVLTSDQPELIEITGPTLAGARFRRGDAVDLAGRVGELLADPARLAQLSIAALERYETLCNPDMNRRALERIYAEAQDLARHEKEF